MLHLIQLQGHTGKGPLPLVSKSLMYAHSLSYRTFLGHRSPGKTRLETVVLNMALWEVGGLGMIVGQLGGGDPTAREHQAP